MSVRTAPLPIPLTPTRQESSRQMSSMREAFKNPAAWGRWPYGVTVTVTSSSVVAGPSSARPRMTYVPGAPNVTVVVSRPSAGIGGANQTGAHGELAPTRKSSHVLICGGSKCDRAGAPKWNHEKCRPLLLRTLPCSGGLRQRSTGSGVSLAGETDALPAPTPLAAGALLPASVPVVMLAAVRRARFLACSSVVALGHAVVGHLCDEHQRLT